MTDQEELASVIEQRAAEDGNFAIAYAILKLAEETSLLATHVKYLGNGNAATTMGAIEGLAMMTKEGLQEIAGALNDISSNLTPLTVERYEDVKL